MLVSIILALTSLQSGAVLADGIVELHTGRLIARPLQTLETRDSMLQIVGTYELLKHIWNFKSLFTRILLLNPLLLQALLPHHYINN